MPFGQGWETELLVTDLERLLYEGEGDYLDFKRTQYPFVGATNEQKAELLKDVLAMVNSWRRTEGYVIIGAEEIPGQKATVVGISDKLDDADLQQFINGKTNSRVEFAYQNVTLDGKAAAIIRVPVQERPRFLKNDFGGLKKGVVYVRRGSSTAEALPDEIAQMGAAAVAIKQLPVLVPFLGNPEKRVRLSEPHKVRSLLLEVPKAKEIPAYAFPSRQRAEGFSGLMPELRSARPEYYRELAKFTRTHRLTTPLFFAVENVGEATAQDVRMKVRVNDPASALTMISWESFPSVPQSSYSHLDNLHNISRSAPAYDYLVERVGDDCIAEVRAEKVQPKSTHWFFEPVYFGGAVPGDYPMEVTLFADNLSSPIVRTITVSLAVEARKVSLQDILDLEHERFVSTKVHQDLVKSWEDGSE